ncbi:DUF1120 domain-containing protein [Serratia fonticola]|uniref:DUF1120 domain-containing protein n=1 Tax=Serratia fonticola TaxID=47917 RepID=UPI002DB9CE8D|nr:DUF1120 domain-containing protein [Serratia fonticola]MEB7886693.1 DUF1120 domain-containing protein [Serratia fonticola]
MKSSLFAFVTLSFTMLSLGTAEAASAPTAELKVVGKINVPSCTVVVPDGGVYDLGKISATLVKAGTTRTKLQEITKNWSVVCDAETYLKVNAIENRANTAVGGVVNNNNFGLGSVNGTGKIGYYGILMSNVKVDGKDTKLFFVGASNTAMDSVYLTTTPPLAWGSATNVFTNGKVFSADLTVSPTLGGKSDMQGTINDIVKVDGSVTLNFVYGI